MYSSNHSKQILQAFKVGDGKVSWQIPKNNLSYKHTVRNGGLLKF